MPVRADISRRVQPRPCIILFICRPKLVTALLALVAATQPVWHTAWVIRPVPRSSEHAPLSASAGGSNTRTNEVPGSGRAVTYCFGGRRRRQDLQRVGGNQVWKARRLAAQTLQQGVEGGKNGVLQTSGQHGMIRSKEPAFDQPVHDLSVEADPALVPAGRRTWPISVPDAGKQQDHRARRNVLATGGRRLKNAVASGDVDRLVFRQRPARFPAKLIQFRMGCGWILPIGRDKRAAGARDIKSPLHVPLSHGDVAEVVFATIGHHSGLLRPIGAS